MFAYSTLDTNTYILQLCCKLVSYQHFPLFRTPLFLLFKMIDKNYLVGTRKEKKKIEQLLLKHQPAHIDYSFAHLSRYMVNLLYESDCRHPVDFDFALEDFIQDLTMDVREIMGQWQPDSFKDYFHAVEDAMWYLKMYMEQTDLFPMPRELEVHEGSSGTVLLLRVRD